MSDSVVYLDMYQVRRQLQQLTEQKRQLEQRLRQLEGLDSCAGKEMQKMPICDSRSA